MQFRTLLCLAALLGIGCPQPPPEAGSDPAAGNPPPHANPDNPTAGQPDGDAANEGDGGGGNDGGTTFGSPPPDGEPPTFADLTEDGADTVTINVTVTGASEGVLDFHAFSGSGAERMPRMVAQEPFKGGKATITAPANFEFELYLAAMVGDLGDEGNDDEPIRGDAMQPINIGTEDLTIAIKMGVTRPVENPVDEVVEDKPEEPPPEE